MDTMNIFILDKNPVVAAQLQCDKHIVKMILECGQMLSTAHRMLDGTLTKRKSKSGKTMSKYWELTGEKEQVLYKAVHTGHPCTVWTMETNSNYNWHYKHFIALCDEYTYRYGKVHMTDTKLRDVLKRPPVMTLYSNDLTPFRLAMGAEPQCINESDPVGSYREYYQTKQDRFKMVWSKRDIPEWFNVSAA
jgi:hypothetical protein|tara:strand:- start:26292 stop:26864 length:573 start_codon:yes stop_codon:yes gene_type:complete